MAVSSSSINVASVTVIATSQGLTVWLSSFARNVNDIAAVAMLNPVCQHQITKETDRSQNMRTNSFIRFTPKPCGLLRPDWDPQLTNPIGQSGSFHPQLGRG